MAFIAAMMDLGVEFVACDNPHATRLTLHILAAVAEHEREAIATRTKLRCRLPRRVASGSAVTALTVLQRLTRLPHWKGQPG